MRTVRVLYHLARADFLERVRRYSFLITIAITIGAGYFFVPPIGANYVTLNLGGYRGVYNSAWVGGLVALLTAMFLWLFGFYLVKNAVERDRQTGVGQIMAATPLRKPAYTVGKWLSNFAFLAASVGILALSALGMQLVRGEELRIESWPLLSPFLLIALPAAAVISGVAVLFETFPGLDGGFGNVVYFFLSIVVLDVSYRSGWDPLGMSALKSSIVSALQSASLPYDGSFGVGYAALEGSMAEWVESASGYVAVGDLRVFRWEGIAWTADMLVARLAWLCAGAAIALTAAVFFRRFDPARGLALRVGPFSRRPRGAPQVAQADAYPVPTRVAVPIRAPVSLGRLTTAEQRYSFPRGLLAELRLMLKTHPVWWHATLAGLIIACLIAPAQEASRVLLPLAWIWPLTVWSAMGTRERRHHAEQLVFSAAHPLGRQLPAMWLAGVIVAMLAGGGWALRLSLTGDWMGLLALGAGALFIPSLALALGTWSGSSKLFEVVYTMWWYVGPMNQVPALDFTGASGEVASPAMPLRYLALTGILFALAVIGRRRQFEI
jgi:hypothetical protein